MNAMYDAFIKIPLTLNVTFQERDAQLKSLGKQFYASPCFWELSYYVSPSVAKRNLRKKYMQTLPSNKIIPKGHNNLNSLL